MSLEGLLKHGWYSKLGSFNTVGSLERSVVGLLYEVEWKYCCKSLLKILFLSQIFFTFSTLSFCSFFSNFKFCSTFQLSSTFSKFSIFSNFPLSFKFSNAKASGQILQHKVFNELLLIVPIKHTTYQAGYDVVAPILMQIENADLNPDNDFLFNLPIEINIKKWC